MALTRKYLKALGIEDEKVDEIVEAHGETVSALKAKIEELQGSAADLDKARRELDELKAKQGSDSDLAKKYEDEHAAFEAYKAEVQGKEADREKRGLYRKLLETSGIDPKRIDSVMKVTDLSGVTVKDGAIEGAEELGKKAAEEWADFVVTSEKRGAKFSEPPASSDPEAPKTLAEALHQKYNR